MEIPVKMQPLNVGLCTLVLVLGICGSVQSINCYWCTFRTLTNGQTDGDFCQSQYKDGPKASCKYGCATIKLSATINGTFRSPASVGRGCATLGSATGCRDLTITELNTMIAAQFRDSKMRGTTCTCNSELCNSAHVLGTAVGLLVVSVLTQMLVIG